MLTDDKLRQIDASYKPFPRFSEWATYPISLTRWNRYSQVLKEKRENVSPELLQQAQDIVRRAAAVDTGAIEGLYETDRGFTFTVATEAAMWRSYVEEKKGEEVRDYIEAQLDAYEYILDIATGKNPLTEAAIRELHEIMCRNQATYRVMTSAGPQERPLPKGKYKSNSNHVRTRTGEYHAYAPVDITPMEMQRLVDEMRSETFLEAHPVLQASYAHYSFVLIHPFADGNGRVARALASIFAYRAESVPLLVLNEQRDEYIDALSVADEGNPRVFINFILERTLDSILVVSDSIVSAQQHDSILSLTELTKLHQTQSGYSHEEIDNAADNLINVVKAKISTYFNDNLDGSIAHSATSKISPGNQSALDTFKTHRFLRNGRCLTLRVTLTTTQLLHNVGTQKYYYLIVPKDASLEDDFLLINEENSSVFAARVSELLPRISGVTDMRISILVDAQARELLADLAQRAKQTNGAI